MTEQPTKTKEQLLSEIIALATEMIEAKEILPFPGIRPEVYSTIKAEQEQFPGYSTPVDEILNRLQTEGMKITLGDHPEAGNVLILPARSNNVDDSLFPHHLQLDEVSDERLRRLIALTFTR